MARWTSPTWWRSRRARPDDGVAMLSVIGTMTVLTLFLLTSLALVLRNAPASRADQDAKTAMAAAEAGVEEYVSRLTADSSYWTNGNVDSGNAAFTSAGRTIPGTTGRASSFSYQVLSSTSDIARTGVIRLRVTGRSSPGNGVPSVSRTITANLQPRGFLRFIYFSDIEVLDPSLMVNPQYATYKGYSYATTSAGTTGTNSTTSYRYMAGLTTVQSQCGQYYYGGRSSLGYTASASTPVYVFNTSTSAVTATLTASGAVAGFACREIQFTSGDTIQGPLHSNDGLQIGGSVLFTDPVTESSWANPPNASQRWWGTGTPNSSGYRPVYAPPMSMPAGNETLLQYVEPRIDDVTGDPGPGCLYTGATRIIFQGSTMKVLSPSTTTAPSRCLDVANRANEQTKTIPPVIYVNSTAASCTAGALGFPMSGESTTMGVTTDYTCTRGTAYVKGTIDGAVTLAGKDDIVITGDLSYQDNATDTDILGLIAGNNVWVYHPVNSSGTNLLSGTATIHYIDAALLSLRHSFIVQNWDVGSALSTSTTSTKLNVRGAIAQKFRGPVGTGNGTSATTGYLKNYVYDARLKNLQPPYFLKPDSSPWTVAQLTDR